MQFFNSDVINNNIKYFRQVCLFNLEKATFGSFKNKKMCYKCVSAIFKIYILKVINNFISQTYP